MIPENTLFTCSSLLIILVHFLHTSHAEQMNPSCSPSACGFIHNISFPFRLKDDPKHCGDPSYELACENNVTTIYLNSQKYYVKEISYHNFTIRLVDASINNNTCSFPTYSVYGLYDFAVYPYDTRSYMRDEFQEALPINFMSCPYPLKNSSFLTETTDCTKSNSSDSRHTYIKFGRMKVTDVKHMCRVDIIVLTSWKFKDSKNVSVSEIHDSLLYGFDLSWFWFGCSNCNPPSDCYPNENDLHKCSPDNFRPNLHTKPFWILGRKPTGIYWKWGLIRRFFRNINSPSAVLVLVLVFILVVLCAGVSIPAKIIIGFTSFWGLLTLANYWQWSLPIESGTRLSLLFITGVIYASRIIVAFPFVMGILIYKFRRRHLSMFHAIEGFLQSDNKLMPIRYSYSDIKKMTKGFREKLGEGGFGSVYKGKLRSGFDVAVKVLGKPGADGKDFMNEIATIGRIHHVNVVKLVGYCAERSKCALVFDFMPNGSLEKYIFSREKMNSLNWERKYEIAVGVARGIEYLHRGCDIQILHFDIKPHNVLLDDKFIPKISDFGLAKFYSRQNNTVTLTAARGTIGYVAPELINRSIGGVSYKADVYSFGMLLMDMVDLKRDLTGNNENSSQYFPYWIYDCFNQGKDIEINGEADGNVNDDNDSTRKIARKMTIVALWCIQMSPGDRPSMNNVVKMLEGEVEHLQIPPRPSYSPQVAATEDQTWSTCSTDSASLLSQVVAPSVEITVED